MSMGMTLCEYVAWAVSLGVVVVFVFLLCWNGYTDYMEEERRRQRRARKEVRHG